MKNNRTSIDESIIIPKSLNELFRTQSNVDDKWKRELKQYLVFNRALKIQIY